MTAAAAAARERFIDRVGLRAIVGGAVVGAAVGFIAVNALGHLRPERYDLAPGKAFSCTVLSVYDGDGPINCAEVDKQGRPIAVRLRGIEAREYDDSCQSPELCPAASGAAAKAILVGLARGRLECVSYGPSFRRVDSRCVNAEGADLSCEMLKSGTAVRWARFDPEGRLAKCVPPPGKRGREADRRATARAAEKASAKAGARRGVAAPRIGIGDDWPAADAAESGDAPGPGGAATAPVQRRETAMLPVPLRRGDFPPRAMAAAGEGRRSAPALPPAAAAPAERRQSTAAMRPPAGAAPAGSQPAGRAT